MFTSRSSAVDAVLERGVRSFSRLAAVLCCVVLAALSASAQGTRGTIRGEATDPNGAVIAGVTVRLVDVARNVEVRTTTTNEEGVYRFAEVEPDTYNIVISATGFAEATLRDAKVEPNRNLQLDAALTVGGANIAIDVPATQELLDRETPTLGTTVDRQRVQDLPLNGRNALQLATLQPGVTASTSPDDGTLFRVNGQRGTENNVTLDGANNNEVALGRTVGESPRPDAIQEFRLLTSNYEAELGRNTGSVVNIVVNSGANAFHGNARFFYRPTFLSAARFFDQNDPTDRPRRGGDDFRRPFERKEFGGNIGGPLYLPRSDAGGVPAFIRDRAFFFIDFEARRQLIGETRTVSLLPTADERNGIITRNVDPRFGMPLPIFDPATGAPFPIIGATPGGGIRQQIPQARISPIARYYLGFLPVPDATGQATVGGDRIENNEYLTSRFDFLVTDRQVINFTFNFFDGEVQSPFTTFNPASVPGFGGDDTTRTFNYVVRYTYTITPNVVNTLLLGYARKNQRTAEPRNTTSPAEIGFTGNFVARTSSAGPPAITLGNRGLTFGNTTIGPLQSIPENFQLQDSVSVVRGDHRFKFGFDGTYYRQKQPFNFFNQGLFIYAGILPGFGNSTGDDLADFLIGTSPLALVTGADARLDLRQNALAAFAQDTWRVRDDLTLSLGLRYEYTGPLTDEFNRVAYFRPGATSQLLTSGRLCNEATGQPIVLAPGARAPRGVVFVGDPDPVLGGTVPEGGVRRDRNNFAPRVGLAYSPAGGDGGLRRTILGERDTVIRAGFGVYYGAIIGFTAIQQLQAPGFTPTFNAFQAPANFVSGPLADPFAPDPFPAFNPLGLPFGGLQARLPNPFLATQSFVTAPTAGFTGQTTDPNIRTPYTYQYNLTFERGFGRDYVASLSYVGNRARRLYAQVQANPSVGTFIRGTPAVTPAPGNQLARLVNPDIATTFTQLVSGANSAYDALQVNFQKRLGDDGLSLQAAYTFSRSINEVDLFQFGFLDLVDRHFNRARASDDVPHRFVVSTLYNLPTGRNRSGLPRVLLDGFTVGGIYQIQSGTPFSVPNPSPSSFDTTGTAGIVSFADLGAPFRRLDPRDNNGLAFNPDAFRIAAVSDLATGFRRGTSGRNQFRLGNGVNNLDLILIKRTPLGGDRANLELRFEVFNALNRTQFTTVDLNLLSPTFGSYTDARESRVIQLGARISF